MREVFAPHPLTNPLRTPQHGRLLLLLILLQLIAIITYRYRPEEVEAESQFKKAQLASFYAVQVSVRLTGRGHTGCLCWISAWLSHSAHLSPLL